MGRVKSKRRASVAKGERRMPHARKRHFLFFAIAKSRLGLYQKKTMFETKMLFFYRVYVPPKATN